MKKLIYCALALATGLFAASCQQENLEPVAQGNTVTYTVEIPEVATKADAVGEGNNVNNLVYAVYRVTNTGLSNEDAKAKLATEPQHFQLIYQEDTPVTEVDGKKKFYVSLELVNDQRYVVIFWAQKGYTWFSVGESFTSVTYPRNAEGKVLGNKDEYDAFTGVDVISVDASVSKDITLVRPFAQLNIATVEYPNRYTEFAVNSTTVLVDGAAESFNVGAQVGATPGSISFDAASQLNQEFSTTHPNYLSMNYVFVPANQSNVKVSYDIETNHYGTVKNTVPNVPVARNYRTNIIGNLITSETEYNVELEQWYTNSNSGTLEVIVDGLVKNQNGDYEISNDNGLIYAINNLWVDEHGVANPKTFYVYPQEYNITDDQIKDVEVTSGTLKVIKDKPMMTRSIVFENIVIKGLSKPLIKYVGENATVVISGVTIQNYEGDDQKGALIGENDGKVIIEDCAVVDETGADDETTELIGDEDGNGNVEPKYEIQGESCVVYDAVQLAAAFAAEEAIVLGADIALEDVLVFPKGRTATLDLKGYKLTYADEEKVATTYAINNHGTLTIKDSYGIGEVNARGIYNGYVAGGDPIPTAKLTIEGGNFNANGTNGGAAVFNYGVAEIKGGKFTGYTAFNNQPGGKMTIDAADITEKTQVYAVQNNGGELIINNINLTQGIGNYNGTLTINGGKIHTTREESSHAIYVAGGEISIHGGDFMGNGNEVINSKSYTANIYGGTFTKDPNGKTSYLLAGANMTIYDGTFVAHATNPAGHPVRSDVTVKGGTFNYKHTSIAEGYMIVENENGTWTVIKSMAKIGSTNYATFQAAIDAVNNGETVTLLSECNENIIFTQTNDKSFIIDGNKQIMRGTIKVIARADQISDVNVLITNFNFKTTDSERNFIESSETNRYPHISVTNCTFEGPSANCTVVPVQIKTPTNFLMENCTANNVFSLFNNNAGGLNCIIRNCTVTNCGSGLNMYSIQTPALIENVKIVASDKKYGIRVNAQYPTTLTIKNCEIDAFIPVVARKASQDFEFVFEGTNKLNGTNTDGLWCAIGDSEYEANGTMPTPATGKVTVTLNDESLAPKGIHGAANIIVDGNCFRPEKVMMKNSDNSWTEFESFKAALTAAPEGAVITISADENLGNYDFNSKNVTILGMADNKPTVTGRFYVSGDSNVTMQNVNFKWNGEKNMPIEVNGLSSSSVLTFKGCDFDNNGNTLPNQNGGFIHITNNFPGVLVVEGCSFKTSSRFGIWGYLSGNETSVSKINKNTFNNCGFCLEGPKTFQNIEFKENTTTGYLRIIAGDNSYTLKNIWIENNNLAKNIDTQYLKATANFENVYFRGNNLQVPAALIGKFITE